MKTVIVEFPWKTLELVDDPHFADPHYEEETFNRLRMVHWPKVAGMFVDVGAHQGIYTSFFGYMAGEAGMVYAFEPNPINWPLLLRNSVPDPHHASVAVIPLAVGRNNSSSFLRCWNDGRPAVTGQGQLIAGEQPNYEIPVRLTSMDSLVFPFLPTLIKIDVEHFEWEVLCGAINTILVHRPRLLIEIHNEANEKQIRRFCAAHKFAVEDWQVSRSDGPPMTHLFIRTDT